MEPVTHILTGACLARTGLNRRAAYATLAMAIGAEFPDIDTLWSLRGPIEGFQHHRGITHTFIGLPVEAAFIVAAMYGVHRWRMHRANLIPPKRPLTKAPIRWGALYGFVLIALLSHLLLDYTNNYGIRPFFPFNGHWYAASIVFIFDPLIFLLLLAALVLPPLFALVGSEVGARRQPFRGRGWAIASLAGVLAIWTFREVQHERAVQLAMAQSAGVDITTAPQPVVPDDGPLPSAPAPVYLSPQRVLASPDPLSPFRWYAVSDFGPFYQLAEIDTAHASVENTHPRQPKLNADPAILAAENSRLGRAYLDWSPMPFIDVSTEFTEAGPSAADDSPSRDVAPPGHRLIAFQDPRFMGDTLLLHASGRVPLTGTVELDAHNHVVEQSMDGRVEK